MLKTPEKKTIPADDKKTDELPDAALDHVSGGGDPGSQSANWEAQKDATQHES